MSDKAPAGWIDRRVRTAMRGEIDALQGVMAALADRIQAHHAEVQAQVQAQASEVRGMIEQLGEEVRARSAEAEAGLNALREAVDRDDRIEMLRSRLEGFSAQYRWDMDQMRQSVAAIAEKLPIIG
jgi:hypothetical protein